MREADVRKRLYGKALEETRNHGTIRLYIYKRNSIRDTDAPRDSKVASMFSGNRG